MVVVVAVAVVVSSSRSGSRSSNSNSNSSSSGSSSSSNSSCSSRSSRNLYLHSCTLRSPVRMAINGQSTFSLPTDSMDTLTSELCKGMVDRENIPCSQVAYSLGGLNSNTMQYSTHYYIKN